MANVLSKSDFYYGAFLTKVLDKGNKAALVSKNEGRGIYELNTDKNDYTVYIKYGNNKDKNSKRWRFNYTHNNIIEIKDYIDKGENIIFAYICAYEDLVDCEIAIASLAEFKKCISLKCNINKSNYIRIYKKSHSPVLRMYGTARSDLKEGKDNTIHLKRNRINKL